MSAGAVGGAWAQAEPEPPPAPDGPADEAPGDPDGAAPDDGTPDDGTPDDGSVGEDTPAAEAAPAPERRTLQVGTRLVPPFAIEREDGSFTGISVDLWERLAEELGFEFEWTAYDLDALLEAVRTGEIDAGVAALTVTGERERALDFTHPFFVTGTGIAVAPRATSPVSALLKSLFSWEFLSLLGGLLLLLLGVGALTWFFERKRNAEEFGGTVIKGLGHGLWWSAVTMTTVGYGDKSPRTIGGRVVALVWMFAAIILISFFTASIASTLTVSSLDTPVKGPGDLPGASVGALESSSTSAWLSEEGIGYRGFPDLDAALVALGEGELDAVVHDAPILRWMVSERYPGKLAVLPNTFNEQYYGVALAQDSPLRDEINPALLDLIASDWWGEVVKRYGSGSN